MLRERSPNKFCERSGFKFCGVSSFVENGVATAPGISDLVSIFLGPSRNKGLESQRNE